MGKELVYDLHTLVVEERPDDDLKLRRTFRYNTSLLPAAQNGGDGDQALVYNPAASQSELCVMMLIGPSWLSCSGRTLQVSRPGASAGGQPGGG